MLPQQYDPHKGIWLDISVFEQFLQVQNKKQQQKEIERARSYYNRLNWQFTEL